jgi:hypothetical protein
MNSDETFEDNRINRALANDQVFAKYQNHYSMQLNRCFYLETLETIKNMKSIEDHPKDPAVHVTMRLSDINENREYALLSRTYLPESVFPVSTHETN